MLFSMLLYGLHGSWMNRPDAYFLGKTDALLGSYRTLAWHLAVEAPYLHSGTDNYPYGEHIFFSGAQPLVVMGLKWWSTYISDLRGHEVGLVNRLQLISLLMGVSFIFLLFRRLHLPVWYAGLASAGVCLLSPQQPYFSMAFGLSHIWVIPTLFLLLMGYESRSSRRYQSLLIGLYLFFLAFIHHYFFVVLTGLLVLYMVVQLVSDFSLRNLRLRLSHLGLMIFLPVVALNVMLRLSDFSADRFSEWTNLGGMGGLFFPADGIQPGAYLGVSAIGFGALMPFWGGFIFGKSWEEAAVHRVNRRFLLGILISSFLLLAVVYGFLGYLPVYSQWMEWVGLPVGVDIRVVYVWPFYYTIYLLAFYTIWNLVSRLKDNLLMNRVLIVIPLLLLGIDATLHQRRILTTPLPVLEEDGKDVELREGLTDSLNFGIYQAILPLSYFEVDGGGDTDEVFQMWERQLIYISGLPVIGTRGVWTSGRRTRQAYAFILGSDGVDAFVSRMFDERPILLVVKDEIPVRYAALAGTAELVYRRGRMGLYSISPGSAVAFCRNNRDLNLRRCREGRSIDTLGIWRSPLPISALYYDPVNSELGGGPALGSGLLRVMAGASKVLFQRMVDGGEYALSCWLRGRWGDIKGASIHIKELSGVVGGIVSPEEVRLDSCVTSVVGEWVMVEVPVEFRVQSKISVVLDGERFSGRCMEVDEILIRRRTDEVFRENKDWIIRNNYWYSKH
jgi:hypothetical protein